ncbi:hypothetical protein Droror1_Dr00020228 [Drosera rotundifolia]
MCLCNGCGMKPFSFVGLRRAVGCAGREVRVVRMPEEVVVVVAGGSGKWVSGSGRRWWFWGKRETGRNRMRVGLVLL